MSDSSISLVGSPQGFLPSSAAPSFEFCRNLMQLHRSFSQVGPEQKKGCLLALPEGIREKIYWHIWDLSGQPAERNYGMEHVLESESRLRQSICRVASEIFRNLSSGLRDRVVQKMRDHQPLVCPQVSQGSDIEPENTELFLESFIECFDGFEMSLPPFEEIEQLIGMSNSGNRSIYWLFKLVGPHIMNQLVLYCRILSHDPQFFEAFVEFVGRMDEVKKIGLEPGELQTVSKSLSANSLVHMDKSMRDHTLVCYILMRAYSLTADREADCSFLIKICDFISSFSIGSEMMFFSQEERVLIGKADQFCSQLRRVLKFHPSLYLHRSPLDLRGDPEKISEGSAGYQAALNYYNGIACSMSILYGILCGGQFSTAESLIPSKNIPIFINFQIRKLNELIEKDENCPDLLRKALLLHIGRIHQRLSESSSDLERYLERLLSGESIMRYSSVFVDQYSSVLDRCYLKKPTQRERLDYIKTLCNYACDHRKEFENFIPRLQEVSTLISEASEQIQKDLFNLQNIPLFLKHGNMEQLHNRLAKAGNWQEQDAIFYDEVSRCCSSAQSIYRDQVELSGGEALLHKQVSKSYRGLTQKWVEMPKSIVNVLDVWIRGESFHRPFLFLGAEAISTDLYRQVAGELGLPPIAPDPQSSSQTSRSQRKHQKATQKKVAQCRSSEKGAKPAPAQTGSQQGDRTKGRLPGSVPLSSSFSSLSSALEANSVGDSFPSLSAPDLEEMRKLLKTYFSNMRPQESRFASASLKDSQEHFDQLLCCMFRLRNQSLSGKLTERALFAFINDTIRHCTLGVEQLLAALYRETNRIQSLDELSPNLTHNLTHILQMSNLNKEDFSPKVRRWIREINRGEIILRDPMLMRQENALLQRILVQGHQLLHAATGSSMSSAEPPDLFPLFKALSDYLDPLAEFLQSTSIYFPLKSGQSGGASVDLQRECSAFFSSFCDEMAGKTLSGPSLEDPLLEQDGEKAEEDLTAEVRYIQKLLQEILFSPCSSGSLEEDKSGLHNQLVHLEQEVLSHCSLQPIETSLHLGNVLLLNQHIVESVLKHLISRAGIFMSLEEDRQHDLIALVQKLKIPEEKFTPQEIEFLRTGKATRQQVRYPAFYASKNGSKPGRLKEMGRLLTVSRNFSSRQSAMQSLEGFTLAGASSVQNMQQIKRFVADDINMMGSIIGKVFAWTANKD